LSWALHAELLARAAGSRIRRPGEKTKSRHIVAVFILLSPDLVLTNLNPKTYR
jgi:hypothetical protein